MAAQTFTSGQVLTAAQMTALQTYATASTVVLSSGSVQAVTNLTTFVGGGNASTSGQFFCVYRFPTAGTVSKLFLQTQGSVAGTAVCTVMLNNSATTLTATFTTTAAQASDTTNSFNVAAGDYISLRVVLSSTYSSATFNGSMLFIGV